MESSCVGIAFLLIDKATQFKLNGIIRWAEENNVFSGASSTAYYKVMFGVRGFQYRRYMQVKITGGYRQQV